MDVNQDIGLQFLHLWQSNMININEQDENQKVDSLRFCLDQFQFLKINERQNYNGFSLQNEISKLSRSYSNLMDSKEKVNNYGAAVLHLNKNFLTESKKWECGIKFNNLIEKMGQEKDCENLSGIAEGNCLPLWNLLNETEPVKAEDLLQEAVIENNSNIKLSTQNEVPNFKISSDNLLEDELQPTDCSREQSKYSRFKFSSSSVVSSNNDSGLTRKRSLQEESSTYKAESEISINSPAKIAKTENYSLSSSSRMNSYAPTKFNDRRHLEKTDNLHSSKVPTKRYPWQTLKESNKADVPTNDCFRTASHQLAINNAKKFGNQQQEQPPPSKLYGNSKRSLGTRKAINCKFTPPIKRDEDDDYGDLGGQSMIPKKGSKSATSGSEESPYAELMLDERMKNIDVKMVELIMNEIMDNGLSVKWDDIAGLELAKSTIQEIVVLPMLRPDIFTGIRSPPKGLLLFGPPGTGKTMIGKCIASQSQSTFFSISASSLTSKWVGEGEKMVRAMFAVARCHQPAVIFIDEIDSLLMQRSDTEHESSRRLKTEFLVQLDGVTTGDDERVLVVGATNRPQELDEAARRRLVKRLYIPLPSIKAREKIISNLLSKQKHNLSPSDNHDISIKSDGYSGADMANLCREAALGPIRSLKFGEIQHISVDQVRPISVEDFVCALKIIRASVSQNDLDLYNDWNFKYGIGQ